MNVVFMLLLFSSLSIKLSTAFKPTYIPSCPPVISPTGSPSSVPTAQPSYSLSPVLLTRQLTSQPSFTPYIPIFKDDAKPSPKPSVKPSAKLVSLSPLMDPTLQPSRFPSKSPTMDPTLQPSQFPSKSPIMDPTLQPSRFPSKSTAIDFTLQPLKSPYLNPTWKPSVLRTLVPSVYPTFTSTPKYLSCRLNTLIFSENFAQSNAILITAESPPNEYFEVTVHVLNVTREDKDEENIFVPSHFVFDPALPDLSLTSSIAESRAGRYSFYCQIKQETDYVIIYPNGIFFEVLQSNTEPPVPTITSAQLSSNGEILLVQFSALTDRGGNQASVTINCSSVVSFSGAMDSVCVWLEDDLFQITLGGSIRVTAGANLTVISNAIRARCTTDASECMLWTTMDSNLGVHVLNPENPISPEIFISAPLQINSFTNLVLDTTSATGSGGRDWYSWNVTVSSTAVNVLKLSSFLEDSFQISPPTSIPAHLLEASHDYNFVFTFCNFYLCCTRSTHTVSVVDQVLPIVSILGPSTRYILRSSALRVYSLAFVAQGNDSSVEILSYSWSLYLNDQILEVSSISKDQTQFALSPYALTLDASYLLVLKVKASNSLFSSATILVHVTSGALVAVITASNVNSVRVGESFVLSGSASYDENTNANTSGLHYKWTCMQELPKLSSFCDVNFELISEDVIKIQPNSNEQIGSQYMFTLLVFDDSNRKDETSTSVKIIQSSNPVVNIIDARTKITIIPENRLKIKSNIETKVDCNSEWFVNDPSISLSKSSLTPLSISISKNLHAHNLVLSNYALVSIPVPYTFSLSCGESVVSIQVFVNAAPSNGRFRVMPSVGVELLTQFTFSTDTWTDEDIPITYEFSYYIGSLERLLFQERSDSTFGISIFPAGDVVDGYLMNCIVYAFDNYDANAYLIQPIIVMYDTSTEYISTSNLLANTSSFYDFNKLKKIISIGSSSLNSDSNNCDRVIDSKEYSNCISNRTNIRYTLLETLNFVNNHDDLSSDSLTAAQFQLSSLSRHFNELSGPSVDLVYNMSSMLIYSAEYLSYVDNADVLLLPIDVATSAALSLNFHNITSYLLPLLEKFGNVVSGSMISGESTKEQVKSNFRISTMVASEGSIHLSIPSNNYSSTASGNMSSCSIQHATDSLEISLIEIIKDVFFNSSQYIANPIFLVVNNDTALSDSIVFMIQTIQEYDFASSPILQTTVRCELNEMTVYELVCPGYESEDQISYACNGTAMEVVITCPIYHTLPMCDVIQSTHNINCQFSNYTSTSTQCNCTIGNKVYDTDRKLVDETVNITTAASMTMVVGVVAVVTTEQIEVTILRSDSLNSSDVNDVCTFNYYNMVKTRQHRIEELKLVADDRHSNVKIESYLNEYIEMFFPAIFRSGSIWSRVWSEMKSHHRYFNILVSHTDEDAEIVRALTGLQLLTVHALLFFLLAVFYDIQFPQDDGSCKYYDTETSCNGEQSGVNSNSHICEWKETANGKYECAWVSTDVSWEAMFLLSIIVEILTAPINFAVDLMFHEILEAPTEQGFQRSTEESVFAVAMKEVSAAVGNLKRSSMKMLGSVAKENPATKIESRIRSTILAPQEILDARARATISSEILLGNVSEFNYSTQSSQYFASSTNKLSFENKSRLSECVRPNDLEVVYNCSKLLEKFLADVKSQRAILQGVEALESFDKHWGEFSFDSTTGDFGHATTDISSAKKVTTIFMDQILSVQHQSVEKTMELHNLAESHVGFEIIHLFVLDMVGRHSSCGKIFSSKFKEEYKRRWIISRYLKGLTLGFVIAMNLFFVWFSLLRALQRGYEWQKVFVTACLTQFLLEVFFYETTETLIMHFFIPNLIRHDILQAVIAMKNTAKTVCKSRKSACVLDVPQFFYVSVNVARNFPDLLESALVLAYHTYLPGEIAKHWKISAATADESIWERLTNIKNFTFSTLLSSCLLWLGAVPSSLQRLMLHISQPLFIFMCVAVFVFLSRHPYWTILAIFILLVQIYLSYISVKNFEVSGTNDSLANGIELNILNAESYTASMNPMLATKNDSNFIASKAKHTTKDSNDHDDNDVDVTDDKDDYDDSEYLDIRKQLRSGNDKAVYRHESGKDNKTSASGSRASLSSVYFNDKITRSNSGINRKKMQGAQEHSHTDNFDL